VGVLALFSSALALPAGAQTTSPDLAVSNLTLKGDFNPGGRVQFEATVNVSGKFTAGTRSLVYAFQLCRANKQACVGVAHGTVFYTPSTATQVSIQTTWQSITPFLPPGAAPAQLMVFVKDPAMQEDFANNEQWMNVSVGELPKAPHQYVKFGKREIDGLNSSKLAKVSLDKCLLACSADSYCKSVDYAPKTKACYLQHKHREEVGKKYKKSSKYDHYARPCRLDESTKQCNT
jgi:hypothetical protein